MQAADRGAQRWHMARRELVRRLNLERPNDQQVDYKADAVDVLVDWICEADDFDEQEQRTRTALGRLRGEDGDG